MSRLKITEIFYSVQGESRTIGIPTVFVRLTACPLRCVYCDTAYAFKGGEWWQIEDILKRVAEFNCKYVVVTGGEPLSQSRCIELLNGLLAENYEVSLETCGALDISKVDQRVSRVMDLKTPDSGEMDKNLYSNIDQLTHNDQVKFVICSRQDYEWSKTQLLEYQLTNKSEVLFSPVWGKIKPADLAQWILEDHLPVRFQVQLHKILWGDEKGR